MNIHSRKWEKKDYKRKIPVFLHFWTRMVRYCFEEQDYDHDIEELTKRRKVIKK